MNNMYQITLIIVTHDHELAAKCDMQIIIRDGKVESIMDHGQAVAVPLSGGSVLRDFREEVSELKVVRPLEASQPHRSRMPSPPSGHDAHQEEGGT